MIRALVIDDYHEHVDTIVNTLNLYGACARGCASGPEGLEIAQDWLPHLIICDGLLEGMKAWQFAARYNNLPHAGVRPYMVALTGFGSTLQRRLCEEHGYDEYCTKPIELSQLIGWIQHGHSRFKLGPVDKQDEK